jgi:hypothetical protein
LNPGLVLDMLELQDPSASAGVAMSNVEATTPTPAKARIFLLLERVTGSVLSLGDRWTGHSTGLDIMRMTQRSAAGNARFLKSGRNRNDAHRASHKPWESSW